MRMSDRHVIHWFRRGLRLHDNPSLAEALERATTLRCIYILDPYFVSQSSYNKWRFLLESLEDLDARLRRINSRLYVLKGQPTAVLPKLAQFDVLSFEQEPEPWGRERDAKIQNLLEEYGVSILSRPSHTLYDLEKILEHNPDPTLTYAQFLDLIQGIGPPNPPISAVTIDSVPALVPVLREKELYNVPTLEELGLNTEECQAVWKGGETEALSRLNKYLSNQVTPRTKACHFLLAQPTGLSPYLRFGCLSPKLVYTELRNLYKKTKVGDPPLSLFGNLLWREFFYLISFNNPKMDQMIGNPYCVQIPWDTSPEELYKWANGLTGYPFIDAAMTQLRKEGVIHQFCKHAVICFLTRGDLFLSWQEGAAIFSDLSLDSDWALNNGTWLWLSGSSFFQNFLRTYCSVNFGRKLDPEGTFIKTYLPALDRLPGRFVHEPWRAGRRIQEDCKSVLGTDYPLPMVEHSLVAKINTQRIVQAYEQLPSFRGFVEKLKGKILQKESDVLDAEEAD